MAQTNRVTPYGEIISTDARGAFMGNRGCLHDTNRNVRQTWTTKAWITCLLEFKGRQRTIMAPGRYTELFFLDEATALAAGHRPCGECRRERFEEFKSLWLAANVGLLPSGYRIISGIDQMIHQERVGSNRQKQTYQDTLGNLPDGVFVMLLEHPNHFYLVHHKQLHRWSPAGYIDHISRPDSDSVTVLTPKSIVKTIQAGFQPIMDPRSAPNAP